MNKDFLQRLKTITNQEYRDELALIEQVKQLLLDHTLAEAQDMEPSNMHDLLGNHKFNSDNFSSEIIPSGWSNFDKELGGFPAGELVVIGARPGMGKTHLLIDLALKMIRKYPVLYVSLDLSERLLLSRILSASLKIDNQKILRTQLNDEEVKRIESFRQRNDKLPLHVYDGAVHSMNAFKAMCRRMVEEKGVRVIFIDYLQLLSSNRYRHNREAEMAYISRMLKSIARELKIVVIAASQLSRSVEMRGGDKRPILSDLRESGAIEQDADKVMFLYRPEYYGFLCDEDGRSTVGLAELIVAKNRMGPITRIALKADLSFSSFTPFEENMFEIYISPKRLNESGLDENDTPF